MITHAQPNTLLCTNLEISVDPVHRDKIECNNQTGEGVCKQIMLSYNGSIELSDDAARATQKGLHEYVGILKDGGAPIYIHAALPASIIYKDWRDDNWKGTVT